MLLFSTLVFDKCPKWNDEIVYRGYRIVAILYYLFSLNKDYIDKSNYL